MNVQPLHHGILFRLYTTLRTITRERFPFGAILCTVGRKGCAQLYELRFETMRRRLLMCSCWASDGRNGRRNAGKIVLIHFHAVLYVDVRQNQNLPL